MRILIGCEQSGVVRRAFRELGHDAWSCDIEQSEDSSEFHIQYAPGPDRAKIRSGTFSGIGKAMAEQWGNKTLTNPLYLL